MSDYAEGKAKLGDRGSIKGRTGFNKESGTQDWASGKVEMDWQGTTKGKTTSKEQE